MARYLLIVFSLLIAACTTPIKEGADGSTAKNPPPPTREQSIYYFQHRLVPDWVHNSDGEFFKSLRVGNIQQFAEVAVDIVDEAFANEIEVRNIEGHEAVLIVYPEPVATPHCYFAIVRHDGDNRYSYLTYEKTIPLAIKEGFYGVVGAWTVDGHSNLGARTYKTAAEFIEDVLSN